ncbi:hypothetical protein [Athalassotoga saccharophila]|uniref:hypothetical protein n=1 Tax=Athalassotoga saccharophila TaxID=1441386 RepID=UPI001379D7BB|nr:hypothetical protein [Athalassotoga saccharophila]BBJ27260.1 hypothetical protein ATHSA_0128 [Athalassotoga saccharophila]
MKIFDLFKKLFSSKKRLIIVSSVAGVIIVFLVIVFAISSLPQKSKNVESVEISFQEGAFDPGNYPISSPITKDSTQYTTLTAISSFVGTPYVLKWKSGTNSMTRSPVIISIPIPSEYYLGLNQSNLEAFEVFQDGTVQSLYGGQISEINGKPYLTAMTYFPGIIALRLKTYNVSYGLIPLNKISNLQSNIVIVPGENANFSGILPNFSFNFWVQDFPNYNVYLFSYPLTTYRDSSFTSQMISYFGSSGYDSYTQYVGNLLSSLLGTLQGNTYIFAQGIGGLIARYAVESNPSAGNVKKVVLFDTPNDGTNLASAYTISNLYNAGDEFVSREFGLSVNSVKYILSTAISYLYSLNFFAKDLSPNSSFLQRLNKMTVPPGITFITIAGTNPGIANSNFGSLTSTFPELVTNLGDGFVSVKSATAFGNQKFTFPYSFSDIFIHSNVIKLLTNLVSTTTSSTLTFKSDNFPQTIQSTTTKISTVSTRVMTYKYLSEGDYIIKKASPGIFLKKIYSVSVPKVGKLEVASNGTYIISSNDVYYLSLGGSAKVYSGNVRFSNLYNGNLYLITDNWQILKFDGTLATFQGTITALNYRNVFVMGNNIYTLSQNSTSTFLSENGKVLLTVPGISGRMWYMPSINSFVVISTSYISLYDLNSMTATFFEPIDDLMKKIDMKSDQTLFPFNSVFVSGKTMYLLSSNYMLLAIDMVQKGVQIIGNGDVGNGKILPYGNYFIVTGDHTLNFYDMVNRVKVPVYQVVNSQVIDATTYNSYLYMITVKGGVYEIEVYQN